MVDYSGKVAVPIAILLNAVSWLGKLEINQYLTVLVSLFSLVYLAIKIYDQWLSARIKRKQLKDLQEPKE